MKIKQDIIPINSKGNSHGMTYIYYADGTLKMCGEYQDGCRHGLWKYYHSNGNRKYEISYNRGIFHGIYQGWDYDGTQTCQGEYVNDLEHGFWKELYESDDESLNGFFRFEGCYNMGFIFGHSIFDERYTYFI